MTRGVRGLETFLIVGRVDALVWIVEAKVRITTPLLSRRRKLTVVAVNEERSFGVVLLQSIDNVGVVNVWTVICQNTKVAADQGPVQNKMWGTRCPDAHYSPKVIATVLGVVHLL